VPSRDRGRPLRILIYNERFAPEIGGVETLVALLARYVHDRGEQVVVATETLGGESDGCAFRVVRRPSRGELSKLVRESDLIHLHSFHAGLFVQAKLRRRRVVYSYHDLTPICPNGTKLEASGPCLHPAGPRVCHRCLVEVGASRRSRKLIRPVVKSMLSVLIDANVCDSRFALARYPLWRKELIACGIDTTLFQPSRSGPTQARPRVVFVGRLVREKGCDVLLRALRRLDEQAVPFTLDVIGSGPELGRLTELAERLGLGSKVRFHGDVVGQPQVEIVQRARVAVVPSIWDEPFGLVAVEAFSCRVPVIAAQVGGLGELVRDVGLTFPRGNAEALASQLQRVLTDDALWRSLADHGRREAIEKYDHRTMGAAYHRLYQRLLES
jgi:glycosyltransferase involved in cell wall biosynthesis